MLELEWAIKGKLTEAKRFIEAGNYQRAYEILKTIEHPVAHKWIATLKRKHHLTDFQPSRDIPDYDIIEASVKPTEDHKTYAAYGVIELTARERYIIEALRAGHNEKAIRAIVAPELIAE